MTVEIKVIDKGRKLIEQRLALLGEQRVLIGVQGPEAGRPHPKGGNPRGEVPKFIQFGTERMRARPIFDLAAAAIKQDLRPEIVDAARRVASKRKSAVSLALKPVGAAAAARLRDAIVALDAVDTGTTRDSVSYTVRDGDRVLERGRPRG